MKELLETGFGLMVTGMSVVFVLLATLVGVVLGVSKVARSFASTAPSAATAPSEAAPLPASQLGHDELVAVIGAALSMHRQRTKTGPRR
jgi:sodium pump decarboxylase gamma subunit